MARPVLVHVCSGCCAESPKWQGQCPQCGEWNSLQQQAAPRAAAAARPGRGTVRAAPARLAPAGAGPARFPSGLAELDRVLGGGIVPGSVTLIGGDPGIGKSTLLLQVAASATASRAMLYATGEESLEQVAMRARRLGLASDALSVLAETDLGTILEAARNLGVALL